MSLSSLPDNSEERVHRKNILLAYVSTWFGCFTDVMLDSSAIIIIYFTLLNADNSIIMFSAALTGIAQIPILIPISSFVDRFGPKNIVKVSCSLACFGYLLIASAAFLPSAASITALTGIMIFSLSRPMWSAAWYPILADILKPEERGSFLGKMRFSYYIITGNVFYILGQLMGKTPPIWLLQTAIAVTGILALGRYVCISKLHLSAKNTASFELKKSFKISIRNSPLVGFSVYSCFLSLVSSAVIPLALLYMKKGINLNADTVQTMSTIGIIGSVTGFLSYGKLQKFFGMRNMQLSIHFLMFIIPIGFFLCRADMPLLNTALGGLIFLAYISQALFNCCFSQECLALSRPGNAAMASAFANTYNSTGIAAGRTASSLLLGHGLLSTRWQYGSFVMNEFQTIFLFCSVGALFCCMLLFILPSVIPQHDDYYNP